MFSKRSAQLEYLDLGSEYYTIEEYNDCMEKLGLIGRFLGGNRATFKAFESLDITPKSILDVGCGGGAFTRLLAKKYPNAEVVGVDTSQDAIRFAMQNRETSVLKNLSFLRLENPRLTGYVKAFDVVTSTLVCHHLPDEQLTKFLIEAARAAKHAVIINDLHRHVVAYGLFSFVAPLFFRNRLITHDGCLSIKRAFTRKDWIKYMASANIDQWQLTWEWAFRWILTIKTSSI